MLVCYGFGSFVLVGKVLSVWLRCLRGWLLSYLVGSLLCWDAPDGFLVYYSCGV